MACSCCGRKYKPTAAQAVAQPIRMSRFRRRTGAINGVIKAGTAPVVVPATTPQETPPAPVVEEKKE